MEPTLSTPVDTVMAGPMPGALDLSGGAPASLEGQIRALVRLGGPEPQDYPLLDGLWAEIFRCSQSGDFGPIEMARLREAFGDAFSLDTMQGFAFRKPHGYPGDFEIMERVYAHYICPSENLANWDRYFQIQAAAQAVRNRKTYFRRLFREYPRTGRRDLDVLNLASGPGRDLFELFREDGAQGLRFDCLDQDGAAIAYARFLCREYADCIRFIRDSAFGFRPDRKYDVIWSAGLFDYFEDSLFRRILKRLLKALKPGGRMVIGNFAPSNPSRPYMHLFDWQLHYRNAGHLLRLAEGCGIPRGQLHVEQEPLGVNLFLHLVAD